MSLERIAENTGNTILMAFVTNTISNLYKNRSLKAKIDMSYRNTLQQAKVNFVNYAVCEGIGKATGRTLNTFMGSFLANFVTERNLLSFASLQNSYYSGIIAQALEKLQTFR